MKYDHFNFIQPTYLEREFCGKTLRFYAVPVKITPMLKNISEDVANAIALLTGSLGKNDSASKMVKTLTDEQSTESHDFGVTPEIAKLRTEERLSAVKTLASTAFSKKSADLIALIIMGSLRDVFPPDDENTPKPEEFFEAFGSTLNHAQVATLLKYSLEASAEVLSPFFSGCLDFLNTKLLEKLSTAWSMPVETGEEE